MYRYLLCLLLVFLKLPTALAQQPLAEARQSSYFTKVFRLTDAQARHLYEKGLGAAPPVFFTQVVDSFATDSAASHRFILPLGYYLVAHTEGAQLVYWLRSETDRQVVVLDNQVDLSVLVRDTLGHPLAAAARLWLRGRAVPYDAATGTFRRAGGGRAGLLALAVGGRTTYHALTRNAGSQSRDGGWGYVHRLSYRVLYGFPLGYLSRPVKGLVHDLRRASEANFGLVGLLRSACNEDVRDERQARREQRRTGTEYGPQPTRWTGYVALSQPRYRPQGDTLRLKARVLHRRTGHPYTSPVGVWLGADYGQPERRLAILHPVRPGSYELLLPLLDSLNLKADTEPTLRLRTRRGRQLLEITFRVEDYELANTHYALRLAHTEHRGGQTQAVYLHGTDANELSLLDARVRLAISPSGQPGAFAGRQLFVPDTLFARRQALDAVGETRINVPENCFPATDLPYIVTATFLNADNERHEERALARRRIDPGQLRLELRADSLLLRYEWADQPSVPHGAILTVRGNATGGPLVALATHHLTLPARLLLDPRATAYEVADSAGRRAELRLDEGNAAVALHAERTTDSLLLRLDNPRQLLVYYFIYRGNRLMRRGQGVALPLAIRAAGSEPWYVSLHYWWGAQLRAGEFAVPLARHQLTVRAEQAAVAYPGQRLNLQYTVTDVAGRPVPDADLTSYAYTSKFDRTEVPRLPNFEQFVAGRVSRRRFGLPAGFENDAEKPAAQPLPWAAWRGRLGLDSLRFYQFLYPESGFFYDYRAAPGGLTQFAPFVLDHGVEVPLLAIYLNGLPVWIHDVNSSEAYSVAANAGLYRLALRTADHLLTLPDIFLRAGCKLTLSIDKNTRCDGLKVEKRGPLRLGEWLDLARSLVLFEQNETTATGYRTGHSAGEPGPMVLGQGPRWQQVRWNNGSGSWLGGPFRPDSVALRRADGLRTAFVPEPLYHYRFWRGQTRLRTARLADYGLLNGSGYGSRAGLPVGDFALTPEQVLAGLLPAPAEKTWTVLPLGALKTEAGQGRLVVRLPGWPAEYMLNRGPNGTSVKRLPAVIWLRLTSIAKVARPRYVPGHRSVEGLAPGSYHLILLLADSSTLTPVEPIRIQPNGTTFVQLLAADYQAAGPRGHAFNQRLRHDLAVPSTLPLRQEMRTETPLNVPNYWNTVVGRVLDAHSNEALPGVTVLVKGTMLGTSTDAEGRFTLAMPNTTAALIFSYIGYATEEWAVHAGEQVSVALRVDAKQLSEVVVTGYGVQQRKSLTYGVVVLTSLMGRVRGVNIVGAPGAAGGITIRGSSALAGALPPLLIVDGLPLNIKLADLDPATIASMKILTGAEATGLYGSRAASGVIFITTKAGPASGAANAGADPRLALRRNFRDYAWWRPTLVTDAQGQARTTVVLPDDVTGWDTFALVSDAHGRLGSTTARLRAFKALRAELAVPRFLVAGDQTRIIGKTLNYLPDTATVATSFQVLGGLRRTQTHRVATSVFDTLTVSAPATGADSIQLTFSLQQANGYQDGEQRTVPVVPAGTRETVGIFAVLTAADTTLTLPVSPGLGEVHIRIEADALPVLLREIEHLSSYAYLCNEQMASKLLGLLLSQRILILQKQPFTQEKNICFLIRRLLVGRHQPEGLWGTWPQSVPSPWATLYVINALLAAEQQGYPVKFDREAIRKYLLNELDLAFAITANLARAHYDGLFGPDDDRLRLLELLHRLGAPLDYASYLQRLNRTSSRLQSLDHDLAILEFRQQLKLPVRLDSLRRYRQLTQFGGVFYADSLRPASYYQYLLASRVATTLQVYRILRADGRHATELLRLRTFLLNQRSGGHWASTYETAQILETIGPDLLPLGAAEPAPNVQISSEEGGRLASSVVLPYVATRPASAGPLTLRKQGGLPVYATVYQTRWNPNPAAQAAPFTVSSTLAGQRGRVIRLRAGQPADLVVTVDVRAEARYVLLEIPIPAGCSYASPHASAAPYETHREYLRNQTGIFLDRLPVGRHTFRVALQPRYPGRYTLNPARAELIYFPTRFGREASKLVMVQ